MKLHHFVVAALLLSSSTELFSAQTLVYNKVSGSGKTTSTYTVDKTANLYTIDIVSKDQTTQIKSDIPYQIISLDYKSKKNTDHYTFTLKNSILTADGEIKGQKLHQTYKISKTPWIQEFDFGLLPLLTSDKKSMNFEILHPKNFNMHKMVAKKQGRETITIEGKSYQAEQVTITLQGFKSMFWKAQLWYDAKTHDLLMYKANEGPHTPTTTICLIEKTGSLD